MPAALGGILSIASSYLQTATVFAWRIVVVLPSLFFFLLWVK
jgi:hypothetical protein